ncbi:hypothetical protein B0I35DRAFT_453382 [Stachybotrys elegans]|uniref:Nephrocystin 3-like N-terminal domain-containing protein n=1 Tax=Stachybotrys elegans TaxID=80388 RepID=A0A8K0SH70_9HYPO|nr:hypothetical protein B0I35DRAFT_453382 [Stachybotrys elegans]
MAGQGSFIPGCSRPVTVDYIDQHLHEQHPLFANPHVQYDAMSGQYAPTTERHGQMPEQYASESQVVVAEQYATNNQVSVDSDDLPPRSDWTHASAMKFWNGIFPDAMTEFQKTEEPRGRSGTDYSIRSPDNWDEIYHRLQAARDKYQQVGGSVGWLQKVRRTVANNITPLAGMAKFGARAALVDPIATPVLAAVELVIDAVKTATSVRQQVVGALDSLIPIYSNVGLASVNLIFTPLDAIERTIGFFTSNEFLRGGKAMLTGGDYEKSMVESPNTIKTRSSNLMEEAAKSHIHEFHMYPRETRKFRRQLVQAVQNENLGLHIINEKQLSIMSFQQNQWLLPPQPGISTGALRLVFNMPNLDLADLAFVVNNKRQLAERERAQAEQIIDTQLFQRWILSASSAKLLVHWDFILPQTFANVSPLSGFCATMTQVLRAKERCVVAVWFCGRHTGLSEAGGRISGFMLTSLIDQLLRQHTFDPRLMYTNDNITAMQTGDLEVLTHLLGWLVRQLPEAKTLFFIIDGVYLLERDECKDEALHVLTTLLCLANDRSVSTTIKVLFTSTPGTDDVREAFEDEDLILNVHTLPQLGWPPNDERMIRELEEMHGTAWM